VPQRRSPDGTRSGIRDEPTRISLPSMGLEHDPEKWMPVFGKDHAQTVSYSVMTIRRKVITL
jgi:hypothetical protein